MHEVSVVSQIIERVLAEASARGAKKVIEVEVEVGQLSFLNIEQMKFAYSMLSKDTLLKGSRLKLKILEAYVRCKNCGFEGNPFYDDDESYHVSRPIFLCPKCGSPVEIIRGMGCTIKKIRLQV